MAADMQVWRAAAGQSKWAESVCVSPFTHQVGHCPEPPSLSQSAALDTSGCCCLSHGLCLPFLILPAECMDLLGSQWSCQRNHPLPLEHFGSVELDLPALFSINRAFVASSGANVRALWICAKGFGACWWCALFAQRWSCCEVNATKRWGKAIGS